MGYSRMVTHNYRTRTGTFLRRALHATKDTPGRGRLASTVMSGFGILKVEWEGRQKKCVKKDNKSRHKSLVVTGL